MKRSRTRSRLAMATVCAVAVSVAVGASGVAAYGHGYVGGQGSDLVARAAMKSNTGLGSVQYEPQSLEGPKGFPSRGPADGMLASAGGLFGGRLDEQSATRWVKNDVRPGLNRVVWQFTAPHSTSEWRYYITKKGWDPNAPLDRGDFELLQKVTHDGSAASNNPAHVLDIPADRAGYHVIYAVWDIADTANAFYNVIDVDIAGAPVVDEEKPTAPLDLEATATTASSITLAWKPATDDSGVNGYRVWRDGVQVGSTAGTTFADTGLAAETLYRYTVTAYDGAGNESDASDSLTVTTPAPTAKDTERPTQPANLHTMSATSTAVALMWTAATDNVGVDRYTVARATAGSAAWTTVGSSRTTTFTDAAVTAGTTYRYVVTAHDAAGNSTASEPLEVTTAGHDSGTGGAPAWSPTGHYLKGDLVTHNGRMYQAVQTHRGYGDPNWINAPSLWMRHTH